MPKIVFTAFSFQYGSGLEMAFSTEKIAESSNRKRKHFDQNGESVLCYAPSGL